MRFLLESHEAVEALCLDPPVQPWESHGGFMVYILCACVVFFMMEVICDEYFVPALQILCKKLNLSDSVAGATFMAAGASSPELFVALIGVLEQSPVGTGTVVGSEIFNMNVIVGGTALVSSVKVALDWRFLMREMVFYAAACVMLIIVLLDQQIMWYEALILVFSYSIYVLVCAKFESLVKCCCPRKKTLELDRSMYKSRGASQPEALTDNDDPGKHATPKESIMGTGDLADFAGGGVMTILDARRDLMQQYHNKSSVPLAGAINDNDIELAPKPVLSRQSSSVKPVLRKLSTGQMEFTMTDTGVDGVGELTFPSPLFKKSGFYNRIGVASQTWQLRYFSFVNCAVGDKGSPLLCYCRNPNNPEEGKTIIRLKKIKDVIVHPNDDQLFKVKMTDHTYRFRAKDLANRDLWVYTLLEKLKTVNNRSNGSEGDDKEEEQHEHNEMGHRLIDFPRHGNILKKMFWLFCAPVYFGFFLTIPDVRKGGKWAKLYPLTLAMVICWLAGMSFGMVNCIDRLGCILSIPSDIMGLTVGSIGTSLPNLFASMLVAKQGLPITAVSNAFGSNVFNIFIALGLPWTIQTCFIAVGEEPYKVQSATIAGTVSCLLGFLLIFAIAVGLCKWVVNRRFGIILIGSYIVFIIYMIVSSSAVALIPAIPQIPIPTHSPIISSKIAVAPSVVAPTNAVPTNAATPTTAAGSAPTNAATN